MRTEKHSNKKNKNKKVWEAILSVIILLSISLGLVLGYYGSKVMTFLDNISVTDEINDDDESIEFTRKLDDLEPFSVLILGLDVEEEEGDSRSDTIIVATINPSSNDIKLVSIPRDMLVTLPNGIQEKINAAYPTGGSILTQEMVGDILDIPIHFYASMDFDGLVELVDAVGGITIDSDLDFTEGDYTNKGKSIHIKEGKQHLDGAEALAYARMRKQDPNGDFGRQARQQEVIVKLLNELASFNTVSNLTEILNTVSSNLSTDATTKQILTIAANYSEAANDVEQITIDGESSRTYFPHYGFEVYTWEPYYESITEVQEKLKKHLELDEDDEKDDNDFDPDDFDIDPEPIEPREEEKKNELEENN